MCTVTWHQEPDRYRLFFNRDELRIRLAAEPPRIHSGPVARFIAPVDGDAGGTWIAANELGLSICLLNDYGVNPPNPVENPTSRGHLVRDLAGATDLPELLERWQQIDHSQYRPFQLLALAPEEDPCLFSWNGTEATQSVEVAMPLCSSSFDEPGADRSRSDLWKEMANEPDLPLRRLHLRFHQSHRPERGPYSVCMHRPDAATVSLTVIEVDPDLVSMAYADGSPCSASFENLTTITRATPATWSDG